jgi:hypothetical protein
MVGGDGCIAMSMDLMPLNCAPKNGEDGTFYLRLQLKKNSQSR